jgi:hypothetical protein
METWESEFTSELNQGYDDHLPNNLNSPHSDSITSINDLHIPGEILIC